MAVRANGDCIRHRIRPTIRELAEVMNFEKRTICPRKWRGLVASLTIVLRSLKHPCFDLEVAHEAGGR